VVVLEYCVQGQINKWTILQLNHHLENLCNTKSDVSLQNTQQRVCNHLVSFTHMLKVNPIGQKNHKINHRFFLSPRSAIGDFFFFSEKHVSSLVFQKKACIYPKEF